MAKAVWAGGHRVTVGLPLPLPERESCDPLIELKPFSFDKDYDGSYMICIAAQPCVRPSRIFKSEIRTEVTSFLRMVAK
jgi:hypothetical protein